MQNLNNTNETGSSPRIRGRKEEKIRVNIVAPILKKKYAKIVMDRIQHQGKKNA